MLSNEESHVLGRTCSGGYRRNGFGISCSFKGKNDSCLLYTSVGRYYVIMPITCLAVDGKRVLSLEKALEVTQSPVLFYDKTGDWHYDIISAYIKSMRGSDPDAALYWLARMLHSGEDPRYVARRLVICASEDVGLADPMAQMCIRDRRQVIGIMT